MGYYSKPALTARTVSVRISETDAANLEQLREALAGAERFSEVERELMSYRGVHTAYNAPLGDGQVIRWAVRFALENLPVDRMTVNSW